MASPSHKCLQHSYDEEAYYFYSRAVVLQQHRELSGAFSDEAKWSDCWKQLSTKNSVGTLRIYHNSPAQLEGTARSLSNNSSVHHLEVGIVEGLEAVIALGNLLQSTKSIQTLVIQHLRDSVEPAAAASSTPNSAQAAINSLTATADAAASSGATQPAAAAEVLFQGLAANSTITSLTLHKLQPAQVHLLATALAQGGCAGQLQQLHLPNARLDPVAATALSDALSSTQPLLTHLSLKGAAFVCQQQQQQQQQQDGVPTCSCACSSLFGPALAAHPSLWHINLQAAHCTPATTQCGSSSSSSAAAVACSRVAAGSTKALCCAGLGEYIVSAHGLQELQLSETGLGDLQATVLGNGLAAAAGRFRGSNSRSKVAGLRVLDLSQNNIGFEGDGALGRGLGLTCPGLQTLKLGHNQLGSEGVASLVEGLLVAAAAATAKGEVKGDRGAAAAAAGGGGGGGGGTQSDVFFLQELDLSKNNITDAKGLQLLLSHLVFQQGLFSLNLSENCLDDVAAQDLAAALTMTGTNSNPVDTHSSSSSSGGGGCSERGVASLDISHNWIKDVGAKAFTALLQSDSCTLTTLLLHHNRISKGGVEGLADAAMLNRRVQEVQLQGNRVPGRLQALEDLRVVLAGRRHKTLLQEQQQQQQQGSCGSSRTSPLSSPRQASQSQAAATTPAAAAAAAAAAEGGESAARSRSSSPGQVDSSSHWQSPLLSPRRRSSFSSSSRRGSDTEQAPVPSPFASAAAGAAVAALMTADNSTAVTTDTADSSRGSSSTGCAGGDSRRRVVAAAGVKRTQAEADAGGAFNAAAAAAAAVAAAAVAAVGSDNSSREEAVLPLLPPGTRRPKALAVQAGGSRNGNSPVSPICGSSSAAEQSYSCSAGRESSSSNAAAVAAAVAAAAAVGEDVVMQPAVVAGPELSGSEGTDTLMHDAAALISISTSNKSAAAGSLELCKAAPAAAGCSSGGVLGASSGGRPFLAGKFLQQRLGAYERSFSFDQWCEEDVLGLSHSAAGFSHPTAGLSHKTAGSGHQLVGISQGQEVIGDPVGQLGPLGSSDGSPGRLGQQAAAAAAAGAAVAAVAAACRVHVADLGGGAVGAAGVLLLEEGSVDGSSSYAHPNWLGVLKEGQYWGSGAAAQGVDGREGFSSELPAVQGLRQVSSLSGWMTDSDAFVRVGQEQLLPGVVRRRYVVVHGAFDSSSGSSSGGTEVTAKADAAVVLRPTGVVASADSSGTGVQQVGGLGSNKSWGLGTASSSGGGRIGGEAGCGVLRPAAASEGALGNRGSSSRSGSEGGNSTGGGGSRNVLCSASRGRGVKGGLVLQPSASAASLRLYSSSDGGGSRSSSMGEEGRDASKCERSESGGSGGVSRQRVVGGCWCCCLGSRRVFEAGLWVLHGLVWCYEILKAPC